MVHAFPRSRTPLTLLALLVCDPGRSTDLPSTLTANINRVASPLGAERRAICVPYTASAGGAWWSLTVTRVTVTCAVLSIGEGPHEW
jgi:hypothetical protein